MQSKRTKGVSLYAQIREELRSELERMDSGDPIPTEAELEQKYGASRITIRRAVEELVAEGLLLRQQGRGTFVQKPKLTHELGLISSWTDQLKRLGFLPKTAKRKITIEKPQAYVAEALSLSLGEDVIRIQRVRLANREPISYMINYLPARLVPDFRKRISTEESVYEFLENEYGLMPAVAVDTVGTRFASEEESEALRVQRKTPVLSVRRLTYLEDGAPLELAIVVSRGDRYQYQVTVHGRPRSRPASKRHLS